jgi:hypothetical protein
MSEKEETATLKKYPADFDQQFTDSLPKESGQAWT